MEHQFIIKQIGNSVCLLHNGVQVYSEDLFAEDYAWQMVRNKESELKKKLGIF